VTYELTSTALPRGTDPLDCLGLRYNCVSNATSKWSSAVANRPPVSMEVSEAALEADAPVLSDRPFAQAADLTLALRRAFYSIKGSPLVNTSPDRSFAATTWKLGLNWRINPVVTLRSTRSRDFRAPNLNDLFAPASTTPTSGFTDNLTGVTPQALLQTGGNPDLKPEVAYTTTVGMVLKPTQTLSLSLDAYDTQIDDLISTVSGFTPQIQQACTSSGGTSNYCALIERANGPTNPVTKWYQTPLNIARLKTRGLDLEANYRVELLGRPFTARMLSAYQPHIYYEQSGVNRLDTAGVISAGSNQAGAVWRIMVSASYSVTDRLTVDWMTRWRSRLHLEQDQTLIALPNTNVPAVAFSNLNLSYRLDRPVAGETVVYLNIQNVTNQRSPVASFSGTSPEPGLFGGYALGDDPVGRYFNLGVRYLF
jgi:outer membrane receptor protein involved in Fe transport